MGGRENTNMRSRVLRVKKVGGYLLIPVLLYGMIYCYTQMGLFLIPPSGLFPSGVTAIIWRHNDEPFFNSPDAISIRGQDAVYLARMKYPFLYREERVIAKLPYMNWAYHISVLGLLTEPK